MHEGRKYKLDECNYWLIDDTFVYKFALWCIYEIFKL